MVQWVKNLTAVAQILGLMQWVKHPVLLQLWHRPLLQFRFDPWTQERPYAMGGLRKEKQTNKQKTQVPTPTLLNTHYKKFTKFTL